MATINNDDFFEGVTESSALKTRIVLKYFNVWSKVMLAYASKAQPGVRLAYLDLFAGPGRYSDGTPSTPLAILERIISDNELRSRLKVHFNDKSSDNVALLRSEVAKLKDIDKLHYPIAFTCEEVGPGFEALLANRPTVPTLLFADPFGYKGISLTLIKSIVAPWGCDCIFFFNYNRVRAALANPNVQEHMLAMFGSEGLSELQQALVDKSPPSAQLTVLEHLTGALKKQNIPYVLPFAFKAITGARTTHHLIFASKAFKGYELMKDVMAKESTDRTEGVPSFEYAPANNQYPLLFSLASPLSELRAQLLRDFSGQCLKVEDIYKQHSVGKPYIEKNYKDALLELEASGLIKAEPNNRRIGTMADHVVITFARKETR